MLRDKATGFQRYRRTMTMLRFLSAMLLGFTLLTASLPAQAASAVVTVNGTPVTDVQLAQRLALHKIEGKGNRTAALNELINEVLQIQEAERLGYTVSEAEIDNAVLDVARQIKVSASNLSKILTDNGVPMSTLRARLKASLAWSRVTQQVVSARVNVSEADIDAKAKAELTAANSFDYILKEVLFIGGNASARTGQANKYRKSFKGCDSAVELSLSYTDAAVRDIGRRHATQFPDALANELAKLNVGGITKPRVVEGGVSMLAVCAKETSQDTTYIANNIRQETGSAGMKAEADKYLAELKAKAQIIKG
ncbi:MULTISPECIES: SurA N-terminal domain-containing protein [unclassified Devosia]|uniref:SurA N-terminal domain-containing protein n=1 Tax=Devosia sp. TaxID=1871048 RepID=UPI0025BE250C|nr:MULTISPECIES: SurA N-terminal domain-containing protein [unclassified Devosia]